LDALLWVVILVSAIFGAVLVDAFVILDWVTFDEVTLPVSFPTDAEAVDETRIKNKIRATEVKVNKCYFLLVFIYLLPHFWFFNSIRCEKTNQFRKLQLLHIHSIFITEVSNN
jgi:hypothetical protein